VRKIKKLVHFGSNLTNYSVCYRLC